MSAAGRLWRASAYFPTEYCSSPGRVSAKSIILRDNSISTAPPPATSRPSRVRALNVLTPSSTALSMSSIILSVEPLITIVEIRDSFAFCSKMTTFVPPISSINTLSQNPSSSFVGAVSLGKGVAFTVLATLLISNLDISLTAIKLYLLI